MAAPIILLSSSPPSHQSIIAPTPPSAQHRHASTTVLTSSSPDLPSLVELASQRPIGNYGTSRLKTGSRAVQVPEGANTGFASAGKLLRDKVLELGNESLTASETIKTTVTDKLKSRGKAAIGDGEAEEALATSKKSRAKAQVIDSGESKVVKRRRKPSTHEQSIELAYVGVAQIVPSIGTQGTTCMKEAASRIKEAVTDLPKLDVAIQQVSVSDVPASPKKRHDLSSAAVGHDNEPSRPKAKRKPAPKSSNFKEVDAVVAIKQPKSRRRANKEPSEKPHRMQKKTGPVSEHFGVGQEDKLPGVAIATGPIANEHLDLDAAPARRLDWTPVKDTVRQRSPSVASIMSITSATHESSAKINLSSFAYPNVADCGTSLSRELLADMVGEPATKKRRLELVDGPALLLDDGTSKPRPKAIGNPLKAEKKAPKRPKTITELTLAPFRPAIAAKEGDELQPVTSGFFAPKTVAMNSLGATSGGNGVDDAFKVPAKPAKARKATKKAQKSVPAQPKLLSPDAFGRRLQKQDVLFASASQLINESPTFLRQYQQAVKQSEEDALVQGREEYEVTVPGIAMPSAVSASFKMPRTLNLGGGMPSYERPAGGLWGADGRDEGEELWMPSQKQQAAVAHVGGADAPIAVETAMDPDAEPSELPLDLPSSRNAPLEGCAIPQLDGSRSFEAPELPHADTEASDESYMDIDDLIGQSFQRSSSVPAMLESGFQEVEASAQGGDSVPSSPLSKLCLDSLASTSASTRLRDCHRSRSRSALESMNPNAQMKLQMPGFQKSLARAMSSATTPAAADAKALPSPNGTISTMVGSTTKKPTALHTAAVAVKRSRGRPRKITDQSDNAAALIKKPRAKKALTKARPMKPKTAKSASSSPSSAKFIHIDDIEDSGPEAPSPPRRSKKSKMPALELVSSQGEIIEPFEEPPEARDAKSRFEEQKDEVYARVTAIVKATPRTTDPSKPSWNEKILLYDPIVLEDFTEWLNEQGATYRRRGAASNVSKTRGKGKKKDADETVRDTDLAITPADGSDQPLEAWMIQKWCEAHSVCCLWRAGLRGGVKARY